MTAAMTAAQRRRRETLAGYGFISPVLIGMAIWTAIPMGLSLYYSFTRYNLPDTPEWVGTENYSGLIQDSRFWNALKVTLIFAVVQVPLSLLVGLMIAVLLNQRVRGMRVFRTLIYLPSIIPIIASTVVFRMMMSPSEFGVVNNVLMKLHIISEPIEFFTSPSTALMSVIFMGLWGAGGSMLIWLAGLQSVPADMYEAATVDGAGVFTRFFRITLPLVSPTILFNAVLGIIGSMQIFVQSFVLNQGTGGSSGAPLGALDFVNVFIYRHAFSYFQMGYGAAAAWVLFVITLVFTLAFFRWSRRWVHYAGERS